MKRNRNTTLLLLLALLCCVCALFGAFLLKNGETVVVSKSVMADASVYEKINGLFAPRPSERDEKVYLGGYPLGMTIDGNGVTVVGLNEFIAEDGKVHCPALESGIQLSDVVVELDGAKIFNSAKLAEIAEKSHGKCITVKYIRGGEVVCGKITPVKDLASGKYRLGLWTKDSSSGIGTLTYIRKNLQFGSLGHPIVDGNGNVVNANGGGIYPCEVNGIVKGQRGTAGELKGSFEFENRIGSIYSNNKYGVFGNLESLPEFANETISVAAVAEVHPGKAEIYTTLDDNVRKAYEVEIIKALNQRSADDKGIVLRVTDETLLDKTGGIVQGMSGSPIVQDGKLVGAVTHVFVNDPTKGYGVYADWMLEN